jgi:hypothetical protein
MPNERYPGAAVRDGYHALILANRTPTQVAVWISFDNEWWVAPNLQGTYVRWRAISSRAVARYNIIHNTNYSIQSEEIAVHEEVVCWQGEFSCTRTVLGTTLVLTFL